MTNVLVIARYNECLRWLGDLPSSLPVILVNKGQEIDEGCLPPQVKVFSRPNIGREGESYLWAMTQVQPSAGFVIFCQGGPFEHSPDFCQLLSGIDEWTDVQPLSLRWKPKRQIPPALLLEHETLHLPYGGRFRPETFSLSTWSPLGFDDPGAAWASHTYRRLHSLVDGTNIAAHFLLACGFTALARAASQHQVGRFSYGAQFAVRASLLCSISEERRSNIIRALTAHPVYGYILERLWLHIFGLRFELPPPGAGRNVTRIEPVKEFMPAESGLELRRLKFQRVFGSMVSRVRQW